MAETTWQARYEHLAARLPALARQAAPVFCGFSACVDARASMHAMDPLLATTEVVPARFRDVLLDRAARGIGGEIFFDWPEGAAWLGARLPLAYALGGTGPQAAATLTALGAPAVMALEDRSAHMLARVPGAILLADADGFVPAARVTPRGHRRPDIFIFEYTAGVPIGPVVPPRSSRIIVRFLDPGIEHDADFERLSLAPPPSFPAPGAGLVSGYNSVRRELLPDEYAYTRRLADGWRRAGARTIHLELAGYDSAALAEEAVTALAGHYTSIGMSQSEFRLYFGEGALGAGMVALAERLGAARVCVHADDWAASAVLGEASDELDALMTGCLLAAARAATDRLALPAAPPAGARYASPPFPEPQRRGAYTLVSCATPHLVSPATTLGLGDSFTAGCLLVLGQAASTTAADGLDRPPVTASFTTKIEQPGGTP